MNFALGVPLGAAETHDQQKQAVYHTIPWCPHGKAVPSGFQEHRYQMTIDHGRHEKLVESLEKSQALDHDRECCHWHSNCFGPSGSFLPPHVGALLAALGDEMGWHHYHQ